MSIYNMNRIKELCEQQLEKDLTQNEEEPVNAEFTLTDNEFKKLWCIFQASEYCSTSDFFKNWKFYLLDDVADKIIFEDNELDHMYGEPYDFTIEECLEEAKQIKIIKGFLEISEDLWIINNRQVIE